MEELHYPGAGSTKKYLEERLRREQQQAAQAQQIQLQILAMQAQNNRRGASSPSTSPTTSLRTCLLYTSRCV